MAETLVAIQDLLAPFDVPSAEGADFTFAASDLANGNYFLCTGREVLLVQNENAGAQTITITSVPDEKGRSEDITTYSIGIGEFAMFGVGLTNSKGWKQTDGKILLQTSAVDVNLAVVRLPAGR